jgi:hypothetical protein
MQNKNPAAEDSGSRIRTFLLKTAMEQMEIRNRFPKILPAGMHLRSHSIDKLNRETGA